MQQDTVSFDWLTCPPISIYRACTQLRASKALFLKLMRVVLRHVPRERWIQLMNGGLKTVNLAWVIKIAVIGCTWLFFMKALLPTRDK